MTGDMTDRYKKTVDALRTAFPETAAYLDRQRRELLTAGMLELSRLRLKRERRKQHRQKRSRQRRKRGW